MNATDTKNAIIFISYSHEDEDLRKALEKQLSMLRRQGLVEIWHDRMLLAGDRFDDRIDENLNVQRQRLWA